MPLAEPVRQWRTQPMHAATLLLRRLMLQREELERAHATALGVNLIDYRAMGVLLGQGVVSPGELSRFLGTTASATSNIIDRLEHVGHLSRELDPSDRRRVRLVPNPDSVSRALGTVRPMVDAVEKALCRMTPEQQDAVVDFLDAAVRSMEDTLESLAAGGAA